MDRLLTLIRRHAVDLVVGLAVVSVLAVVLVSAVLP